MPDAQDDYPTDPSRATLVRLPSSGQSIIAYEDLFPSAGDADFNDYVVRVTNEEDLDASGKIRRVRGSYTHMARGAGYKHTLHIKLPSAAFSYTLNRYAANGTLESSSSGQNASAQALEILPSSDTTISQSNTSSSQTLVTGKKADIELILDAASTRAAVGDAPYDLFIKVINTSKEVHFPRLYTNGDGSDQYMDANGFPWALQVPNQWNWPLESHDIEDGYSGFKPWYLSMGTTNQNWYESFNASHVFSAGAPASYIGQAYASRAVLFLTILIGAGGLALILAARRKQTQN
jgi:LruC domain-containing protein